MRSLLETMDSATRSPAAAKKPPTEAPPERDAASGESAASTLAGISEQLVVYTNVDSLPGRASACLRCGGNKFWLDGYGQMLCDECAPAAIEEMIRSRWMSRDGRWLLFRGGEYHPICRAKEELFGKKCSDSCGLIRERWVETPSKTGYPRLECGRCGRFIGYVKPPKPKPQKAR